MPQTNLAISAEMEFLLAEPHSETAADAERRGWHPITPTVPMGELAHVDKVRHEIEHDYEALVPTTPDEEKRRESWLNYVNSNQLTPADIVNYRIYQATSSPTLSYASYPLGSTYSQVTAHAGQTEFRGPGIYQRGWYDNPGISEVRQTPTPERQFRAVHTRLLTTIGNIAAAQGHRVYRATTHLNMSAFRGEAPVLGDPNADLNPYKAVAAGLRAVYREGGLLNPAASYVRTRLECSPLRTGDVRLLPGRVELRNYENLDGPDQSNMERLGRIGIRHGVDGISDEDRDKTYTAHMLQVSKPGEYDKESDLPFIRAFEACGYSNDKLIMSDRYVQDASAVMSSLLSRKVSVNAYEMERFITTAFALSNEGQISAKSLALREFGYPIRQEDTDMINARLAPYTVRPREMVFHKILDCAREEQLRGLASAKILPTLDPKGYAELRAAYSV